MVYVDVFVAGVGKWYEFKCEETALIRDIIKEIYDVIRDKESIICEKQIDLELYLACIENKRILPLDFKLEESGVENGNRLILISLTAHFCFSLSCTAKYTVLIPPCPITDRILYFPSSTKPAFNISPSHPSKKY